MSDPKQAVILVHGMGQQVPMETLRSFVETMWVKNTTIHARLSDDPGTTNPIWWKPDNSTGSLELSRITTRHIHKDDKTIEGPRTDFYELYWADVTEGNTLAQLKDWFLKLMWRPPREVPPHVKPIWRFLWLATFALVGLWAWKGLAGALCPKDAPTAWLSSNLDAASAKSICQVLTSGWVTFAVWVLTIASPIFLGFAVNYFGDVARYTRAAPFNIMARRAARERGLALLRALTERKDYQRIVLVGHSLGSILAYDILRFLWSERDDMLRMPQDAPLQGAWQAVETAAQALRNVDSEENGRAYADARTRLFALLSQRRGKERWIVSDFVTVGSPLAHAEFLLERESEAFFGGVAERRFPVSPPLRDPPGDLIYRDTTGANFRPRQRAHHATPFAAVAWTNIYDPRRFIFLGDLVSGPVRRLFGHGVKDVKVCIRHPERRRIFTHTLYWTDTRPPEEPDLPEGDHLKELRAALRLDPQRGG